MSNTVKDFILAKIYYHQCKYDDGLKSKDRKKNNPDFLAYHLEQVELYKADLVKHEQRTTRSRHYAKV